MMTQWPEEKGLATGSGFLYNKIVIPILWGVIRVYRNERKLLE